MYYKITKACKENKSGMIKFINKHLQEMFNNVFYSSDRIMLDANLDESRKGFRYHITAPSFKCYYPNLKVWINFDELAKDIVREFKHEQMNLPSLFSTSTMLGVDIGWIVVGYHNYLEARVCVKTPDDGYDWFFTNQVLIYYLHEDEDYNAYLNRIIKLDDEELEKELDKLFEYSEVTIIAYIKKLESILDDFIDKKYFKDYPPEQVLKYIDNYYNTEVLENLSLKELFDKVYNDEEDL